MGSTTEISWCDATFNPWEGCTKVSPGCAHCYAEARNQRWSGGKNWGKGAPRRRTSVSNWKQPLKWDRDAGRSLNARTTIDRPRVFCASLADWLDEEVPLEWLADLLALIHAAPNLDWILLTKRPENWFHRLSLLPLDRYPQELVDWVVAWMYKDPPANVWIGATVEDQTRAEERIPLLLSIPARVRFLSCEPLLGPLDLAFTCFNGADSFGTMPGIHWAICGGESGHGARSMNPDWARELRFQCDNAGVAFFMKQMGGSRDARGELSQIPEDLRIRQFPQLTAAKD